MSNALTDLAACTTRVVGAEPDEVAPDGSLIFWLCRNAQASTCLCVLMPGKVSAPVRHHRASELWYIVAGHGELYRSQSNEARPLALRAGVSVTIATGEVFQFRAAPDAALTIHITTTPPWEGDSEAQTDVVGYW